MTGQIICCLPNSVFSARVVHQRAKNFVAAFFDTISVDRRKRKLAMTFHMTLLSFDGEGKGVALVEKSKQILFRQLARRAMTATKSDSDT